MQEFNITRSYFLLCIILIFYSAVIFSTMLLEIYGLLKLIIICCSLYYGYHDLVLHAIKRNKNSIRIIALSSTGTNSHLVTYNKTVIFNTLISSIRLFWPVFIIIIVHDKHKKIPIIIAFDCMKKAEFKSLLMLIKYKRCT